MNSYANALLLDEYQEEAAIAASSSQAQTNQYQGFLRGE